MKTKQSNKETQLFYYKNNYKKLNSSQQQKKNFTNQLSDKPGRNNEKIKSYTDVIMTILVTCKNYKYLDRENVAIFMRVIEFFVQLLKFLLSSFSCFLCHVGQRGFILPPYPLNSLCF